MKTKIAAVQKRCDAAATPKWGDTYSEHLDFLKFAGSALPNATADLEEVGRLLKDLEAYYYEGIGQLTHIAARIRKFLEVE